MIPPEYWDDPNVDWNEPPEPQDLIGLILSIIFIFAYACCEL